MKEIHGRNAKIKPKKFNNSEDPCYTCLKTCEATPQEIIHEYKILDVFKAWILRLNYESGI